MLDIGVMMGIEHTVIYMATAFPTEDVGTRVERCVFYVTTFYLVSSTSLERPGVALFLNETIYLLGKQALAYDRQ